MCDALEDVAAAQQEAAAGAHGGGDQHGRGRGQAQRAGARHNQDVDRQLGAQQDRAAARRRRHAVQRAREEARPCSAATSS